MPIWLLHCRDGRAFRSRYVTRGFIRDYAGSDEAFVDALLEVGRLLDVRAVVYPTHDYHVRVLAENFDRLSEFYHIQINHRKAVEANSKRWQYALCDRLGVPRPRTSHCETAEAFHALASGKVELQFPWLLKPYARNENPIKDVTIRAAQVNSVDEFERLMEKHPALRHGLLVSEVVPGGPDNIWAFTGYCDRPGSVLAGWTGRKLTQRPEMFGVFSTSESRLNDKVEQQGRVLLEVSEHMGIGEPEFKYDARDGKYKLTEINPRAHMWHMTGFYAGVNLPLIQYYHLVGDEQRCRQLCRRQDERPARLIFMGSELQNIVDHRPTRKFIGNAVRALLRSNKHFIVWRRDDPRPFYVGLRQDVKQMAGLFVRRIKSAFHRSVG